MALASPRDSHSRWVFWLKILLPLGALVILSTVFLVSSSNRPEDLIPYADVDLADLAREPRLTAPDFAGMTTDGAALTLKAAEARPSLPGTSNGGLISKLNGLLETPDGAKTSLMAAEARLDPVDRVVVLSGGIVLGSSAGYRVETKEIRVALDRTSIDSTGAIVAMGPAGGISAGSMHLGLAQDGGAGYVIVFKGGVRLTYLPTQGGAEK